MRTMRGYASALAHGELTHYEFALLAWLHTVGGSWEGTTRGLHAELAWPHGTEHLKVTLRALVEARHVLRTGPPRSRAPYALELAPLSVLSVANPDGESDCGAPGGGAVVTTVCVVHCQCSKGLETHGNANGVAHCTPVPTGEIESLSAEWRASPGTTDEALREAGREFLAAVRNPG